MLKWHLSLVRRRLNKIGANRLKMRGNSKTLRLSLARKFYSWPRVNKIKSTSGSSSRGKRRPTGSRVVASKDREPIPPTSPCNEWIVTTVAYSSTRVPIASDLRSRLVELVHRSITRLTTVTSSRQRVRTQGRASVSLTRRLRKLWQKITPGTTLNLLAKIAK